GEIFGDAFTSDSSRVIYYNNVANVGQGQVGQLNVATVGGGNPNILGSKVWGSWAGKGTRVAFNPNYKAGKYNGRADLFAGDAVGNPSIVVMQAEADFYVDSTRGNLIYAVQTGQAGVYVYPIP